MKKFLPIGIGIVTFVILSGFLWLGLFSGWQEKLADNLFLPQAPRPDIAIIAIDDRSINTLGRWPWDRKIHAQLLELLSTVKPKAVGYDVAFPETSNSQSDQLLNQAFAKHNIILPVEQVKDGLQKPSDIFKTKTGLVNVLIDADGIVRKVSKDSFSAKIIDRVPQIADDYLRVNYVGKPGSFATYSFVDVINGQIKPDIFSGKYVLVGTTAVDLHDVQITPTSAGAEMPGVEIHANAMQTILDGKYLVLEKPWFSALTILIMVILTVIIIYLPLGLLWMNLLSILILAGYFIYVFISFDQGVIRNLIFPPLAILIIDLSNLVYRYLSERAQKQYIKKAFSYYLSESVLKEILKDPNKLKLGGQRQEITVLFSDIAGFTSISEKMPPEELAKMLNDYLTRMTNIVFANAGVLDKYIGDAVMAFWNAPIANADHAYLACKTALEMQKAAGEFGMRIGINTGDMVVGNMGSQMRFDYSLLGDNVNLGSRLEGTNKEYGTKILISESTNKQISNKLVTRFIDIVAVKGKEQGIGIYELRELGQPDAKEKSFLDQFAAARLEYQNGKFAKAKDLFAKLHKDYPQDGPSRIFLDRSQIYCENPPSNWRGIYYATAK